MKTYVTQGLVKTETHVHGGELLCCPDCKEHSDLVMHTWSLNQGLVLERDGLFAEYFCRHCSKTYTLGLFNTSMGEDKIAPTINWFREETKQEKDFRETPSKYIAVVPHGSEGCKPLNIENCPLFKKHGDPIQGCVGGSGDNYCSGYWGHSGDDVIECVEK